MKLFEMSWIGVLKTWLLLAPVNVKDLNSKYFFLSEERRNFFIFHFAAIVYYLGKQVLFTQLTDY